VGGIARGYNAIVNTIFLVTGILSVVAVLAWIGLLIWGAIEDGRAERRDLPPPRR
jgi:hypothetical protein